MSEKLSISQWAEEDKPREKLERLGAAALSNAELLAILIGSGSQDESAVDLMKHIMSDCDNNLNSLGKMSIKELTRYKGMGPAKALLPVSWGSAVPSISWAIAPIWALLSPSTTTCSPRCRTSTQRKHGFS